MHDHLVESLAIVHWFAKHTLRYAFQNFKEWWIIIYFRISSVSTNWKEINSTGCFTSNMYFSIEYCRLYRLPVSKICWGLDLEQAAKLASQAKPGKKLGLLCTVNIGWKYWLSRNGTKIHSNIVHLLLIKDLKSKLNLA